MNGLNKVNINKISIVIASFNYCHYLCNAIESVLAQTYPHFELIIIDDGSSDDSLSIAKKYARRDGRISVFTHPKNANRGLISTLRLGLSMSTGEWIVFLEADDWLERTYIEDKLPFLEGYSCIVNGIILEAESNCDITWQTAYAHRVLNKIHENSNNPKALSCEILRENIIPTFSCVMAKREILLGLDWNTPVEKWLDWYLWIQLFQFEKVFALKKHLTHWRIHRNSQNNRKKIPSYFNDVKKFRASVRKVLASMDTADKSYKLKILNTSLIIFLYRRFYLSSRVVGIIPLLKHVISRINFR
ncbi:glycosyltransferase family 2 protein [Parasutterella muris]|uniref:Glycosyltransferase n=1 Tax=Parasutterella muris TaxID=2565572 RepID=A0A6L6YJK6_9BURK|nr:glycosyltransferase family 2 protein [Parasutterella muris]MVX57910.1 glycosyltransferase [Parasutterella muris]